MRAAGWWRATRRRGGRDAALCARHAAPRRSALLARRRVDAPHPPQTPSPPSSIPHTTLERPPLPPARPVGWDHGCTCGARSRGLGEGAAGWRAQALHRPAGAVLPRGWVGGRGLGVRAREGGRARRGHAVVGPARAGSGARGREPWLGRARARRLRGLGSPHRVGRANGVATGRGSGGAASAAGGRGVRARRARPARAPRAPCGAASAPESNSGARRRRRLRPRHRAPRRELASGRRARGRAGVRRRPSCRTARGPRRGARWPRRRRHHSTEENRAPAARPRMRPRCGARARLVGDGGGEWWLCEVESGDPERHHNTFPSPAPPTAPGRVSHVGQHDDSV